MDDQRGTETRTERPLNRATLRWEKDLVFTATTPRGYDLEFDSANEWGCMPVEALLMSLGGCLAMDVVMILEKMRCTVSSLSMEMEGERRATLPKHFDRIRVILHLAGEGITEENAKRAVTLSQEKYCSVLHTLRDDLEVEVEIRL